MFGGAYFGKGYFGGEYWGPGDVPAPPPPVPPEPDITPPGGGGGWVGPDDLAAFNRLVARVQAAQKQLQQDKQDDTQALRDMIAQELGILPEIPGELSAEAFAEWSTDPAVEASLKRLDQILSEIGLAQALAAEQLAFIRDREREEEDIEMILLTIH